MIFRKSACPLRRVQTKMYLPEGPFFKDSLARASTYKCQFVISGMGEGRGGGGGGGRVHLTNFQRCLCVVETRRR